jgi:hypothetical protein
VKTTGKWLWTNKEVTKEEVERVTRENDGDGHFEDGSTVLLSNDYVTKEELTLLIEEQNKPNDY